MDPEQVVIFKDELEKRGLDPEQWRDHVEQSRSVCLAYAEMVRLTESYATNTIWHLKGSAESFEAVLYCQKVFDEFSKATGASATFAVLEAC
jgi:hypothetical protein